MNELLTKLKAIDASFCTDPTTCSNHSTPSNLRITALITNPSLSDFRKWVADVKKAISDCTNKCKLNKCEIPVGGIPDLAGLLKNLLGSLNLTVLGFKKNGSGLRNSPEKSNWLSNPN